MNEWVAAAVSQPHECSTVTQTKYLLTGMEVLQEFVQNLLHMEKRLTTRYTLLQREDGGGG